MIIVYDLQNLNWNHVVQYLYLMLTGVLSVLDSVTLVKVTVTVVDLCVGQTRLETEEN